MNKQFYQPKPISGGKLEKKGGEEELALNYKKRGENMETYYTFYCTQESIQFLN